MSNKDAPNNAERLMDIRAHYWSLKTLSEKILYLRSHSREDRTRLGMADEAICNEIAAFATSEEGKAWHRDNP